MLAGMKHIDPEEVDGWVAANVRQWRESKQLTQLELARLAGVTHEIIRNVEGCRVKATPSLFARLANVFQVPMSVFLVENVFVKRGPGRPRKTSQN